MVWMVEAVLYGISAVVFKTNTDSYRTWHKIILGLATLITIFNNIHHFVLWAEWLTDINNIPCTKGYDLWVYKVYGIATMIELFCIIFQIKNALYLRKIIKGQIIEMNDWKDCHNRNMMIMMFIGLWGLTANITSIQFYFSTIFLYYVH